MRTFIFFASLIALALVALAPVIREWRRNRNRRNQFRERARFEGVLYSNEGKHHHD